MAVRGVKIKMEIMWGQHVAAHDVWLGRLYGALLVKESGAVTHLVVKRGHGRSRLRTITVNSVKKCASEAIYTEMSLDEALQQPTLTRLDDEQFIVALTSKTRVRTSDGKKLRLKGIRTAGDQNSMEWLVVSGRISRKRLLLPCDRIDRFTTGEVTMAIKSSGLEAMPAYRPDLHVEAELRDRLGSASTVPRDELKGITLTVEEGVVAFRGNVKSPHTVEALRDVTRLVRGATGLLMDVKSDLDLEYEIAAALAARTRGNGGPISVSSRLGEVSLVGHLPGEGECAELIRAASAVQGVKSVDLAGGRVHS